MVLEQSSGLASVGVIPELFEIRHVFILSFGLRLSVELMWDLS